MAEPKVTMCREADLTVSRLISGSTGFDEKTGIAFTTKDQTVTTVITKEYCESGEEAAVTKKLKDLVEGFCTGIDPKTNKNLTNGGTVSQCAVSNEYPTPTSESIPL